jgi:hypothetical protein
VSPEPPDIPEGLRYQAAHARWLAGQFPGDEVAERLMVYARELEAEQPNWSERRLASHPAIPASGSLITARLTPPAKRWSSLPLSASSPASLRSEVPKATESAIPSSKFFAQSVQPPRLAAHLRSTVQEPCLHRRGRLPHTMASASSLVASISSLRSVGMPSKSTL